MATGGITVPEVDVDEARRQCVLIEKGLAYSKQQLIAHRSKLWKLLEHSIEAVNELIEVSSDVHVVDKERQEFDKVLQEFTDITAVYKRLLTDEELSAVEVELDRLDKVIADFKTSVYTWLRQQKSNSNRSVISVRTNATPGKSSKRSSAVSDSRMRQLAKLAALETSKRLQIWRLN